MEEKTTVSSLKQSSLRTSPTEDEIFVAHILLDLQSMIWMLESGSRLEWGFKKRRSRFNDLSATPSFQKTDDEIEERRQPQPKAAVEEISATASPVTPLAFSLSESDDKFRHRFRSSKKRSREKYIAMVEELTQRRDFLREEIVNVTNYYSKLVGHNFKLKAMKYEVLSSYQHRRTRVEQLQPLAVDQMAEKFQHSVGQNVAQFHSSHNGLGLANSVGPLGIPDMNISADETHLPGPLDVSRDFTDRRARFAEARRRRMDIIKMKAVRSGACSIKFGRTR